jgi:hypothetical protein
MERLFWQDFGRVRVHAGPAAARSASAVRARAFTVGNDVFFAAGQYAPAGLRGRRLLAHELAHVAQHRTDPGIAGQVQRKPDTEQEADEDERPAEAESVPAPGSGRQTHLCGPGGCLSDADLAALGEQLTDPELRRLQAQERQADAQRKAQEAESDATRHVRLMEFRSVMAQKHYLPEDVRDYIHKYLTMRDLQVLKRFGFEFPTNVFTRYKIRTRVIDAIERYHADWETKNGGEPAAQDENRQIDEFQAVVDADTARKRAAYDPQVAEAISGGIFGAIGYGIAGDEGAKAGAALDGILLGAGGIAEARQSMPSAPAQRDTVAEVRQAASRQESSRTAPERPAAEPAVTEPPATKPPVSEPPVAKPAPTQPATSEGATAPETPALEATPSKNAAPDPRVSSAAPKGPKTPKTPTAPKAPKAPKTPGAPKTPAAPSAPKAPKAPKTPSAPKAAKTLGAPKAPKRSKYDDDLDTRIATKQRDLDAAARKTLEYQAGRVEQGRSQKGGPAKELWNIKEELYVLERARAHPDRAVLEQVQLLGVKTPDGKLIPTQQLSTEGRIVDFIEVAGNQVLGGEVKSANELVNSVQGLRGADMEGTFRDTSKVGGQRATENAVVRAARKLNGTLVFKGKDVRTGAATSLEVSPQDYRATVVSYDQISPN